MCVCSGADGGCGSVHVVHTLSSGSPLQSRKVRKCPVTADAVCSDWLAC